MKYQTPVKRIINALTNKIYIYTNINNKIGIKYIHFGVI